MISISDQRTITNEEVMELYRANGWSAAGRPTELYQALLHAHTLVTARNDGRLVGLGNAISDGYLVVYYPHLLVHPDYQGRGIGRMIMEKMQEKYAHFHMQMLTADGEAIAFYKKMGFKQAGQTLPMWIYQGEEHE